MDRLTTVLATQSRLAKLSSLREPALSLLMMFTATVGVCAESFQPQYDIQPRPLSLIEPGAVINAEPPANWSHLIIQSHPRVCAGDLDDISKSYIKMARLISSAILANVIRNTTDNGPPFRLGNVAVGSSMKIHGNNTIVTPKTYKKLGGRLNMFEHVLLREFHKREQMVTLVARSETMALIDTPVSAHWQEKNQQMVLRYAILIDGQNGRLASLVWMMDREEPDDFGNVVSKVQWLPPNHVEDSRLHVDADEVMFSLPTDDAFAIIHEPMGDHHLTPDEPLKELMGQPELTQQSARQLEISLHYLLAEFTAGLAPDGTTTPVPPKTPANSP